MKDYIKIKNFFSPKKHHEESEKVGEKDIYRKSIPLRTHVQNISLINQ